MGSLNIGLLQSKSNATLRKSVQLAARWSVNVDIAPQVASGQKCNLEHRIAATCQKFLFWGRKSALSRCVSISLSVSRCGALENQLHVGAGLLERRIEGLRSER